jgi:hypothetical protein
MRHATLLSGEPSDTFLKVMSFYEKTGVIESIAAWQLCRTTRNLAANDYETDYADIAEYFNALHILEAQLIGDAAKFIHYSQDALGVTPIHQDFASDFQAIVHGRA